MENDINEFGGTTEELFLKQSTRESGQIEADEYRAEKQNVKSYIGTKIVNAKPQHHSDFLISTGKSVSPNQETLGDGYRVIYEDGYTSWSPKAVFERSYREITLAEKGMLM
jgi:hypothetical protein